MKFSRTLRVKVACGIIAFVLLACGGQPEQVGQDPVVKVTDVLKKDVPLYHQFVGEVSGLYDIPIRARVDGYLEGMFFREGSKVSKGQLLYEIDAQTYLAEVANKQSEVAEARTRLVNAENDLRRIKPLAEKNAVSQSDLDAAIAAEGAAKAAVEAALARLEIASINLGYTKIKSPIKGVIGKTQAKRGEYVGREPNPVILNTVSRIDTILVQFFITEAEYLQVAREILAQGLKPEEPRQTENLDLILSDGTIHPHKGSVNFIDREVNPTTGSILVQASFPNPNGLIRPGQFARVKVQSNVVKDAKLVPLRCVLEIQGKQNVYIVDEEGMAQLRPIEVKTTYGDLVLVKSGIEHGDKIIIEGLQALRSGVKVQSEEVAFESKSDILN